jgi:Uma2 family endonuclease
METIQSMTQTLEQRIYSPEEYLELELASETRSEYRNGAIIPMTGGTPDHNELAINLASLLKAALRGKTYRIFATDQRLWIPDRNLYTYPDVMVIEKPLQLQTGRTDTVTTPALWLKCYPNQPKITIGVKNFIPTVPSTASANIFSSISTTSA